jgi:glutathione synthase/RimK-type ligase-like ATP-grasp enzyme
MYQLGIISSDFIGHPIIKKEDFESRELLKSIKKLKIPTLFIDPTKIHIELLNDEIALFYEHEKKNNCHELINLSSLKALLVRRTRGFTEQIYDFINLLATHSSKTKIYDPPKSFNRPLSKISTFNTRFGLVKQPRSLIVPGNKVPEYLPIEFPLVAKPSHGWRGYGVKLCENMSDLEEYFATRNNSLGYAIIIQEKIQTQDEYRVFLINGKSIGAVVKINHKKFAKNIAQNGKFMKRDIKRLDEIIDVAEKCAQRESLTFAGADVTIHNNEIYILECNRNPEFKGFSEAMNINVADKIIEFIIEDASLTSSNDCIINNIGNDLAPSETELKHFEEFEEKLSEFKKYINAEFKTLKEDINILNEALKRDYLKGDISKTSCGDNTNNFLLNMIKTHPGFTYQAMSDVADKIIGTFGMHIF